MKVSKKKKKSQSNQGENKGIMFINAEDEVLYQVMSLLFHCTIVPHDSHYISLVLAKSLFTKPYILLKIAKLSYYIWLNCRS